MLKKTLCLFAFAVSLLPSLSALGQSASEVSVERGVAMKTRDGVTLYADIYRPAGEGPFPVLLQMCIRDSSQYRVPVAPDAAAQHRIALFGGTECLRLSNRWKV